MVFLVRVVTKNFMLAHRTRSFNEIPIETSIIADAENVEQYIQNFVMKMDEDAQGPLLYLIPIAMRINVFIVNVDLSAKKRVRNFILNIIQA